MSINEMKPEEFIGMLQVITSYAAKMSIWGYPFLYCTSSCGLKGWPPYSLWEYVK